MRRMRRLAAGGVMQTLSPLDFALLRVETADVSLHIGSVAILKGPVPSDAEVAEVINAKLPAVPRYRQVVREVPLRLGRPVWVDDRSFDLSNHVRRTALPAPGSERELDLLVGRLMSQRLRRDRPLWEVWIVEGMIEDSWALVAKVHHCIADGTSGAGLLEAVFDHDPAAVAPASVPWAPQSPPGRARLVAESLAPHIRPRDLTAAATAVMRRPRRSAAAAAQRLRGLADFGLHARAASRSSLAGQVAPNRSWSRCEIAIKDVRTIRQALGGTLNDVVVSAVTRGLRDLLISRSELTERACVRTLIPVSVRATGTHGGTGNQITAVVAELPVHETGHLARLAAVRSELDRLKRSGEAQDGELLAEPASLIPGPLLTYGLGGLFRIPQRFLTTVVTNVPGPRNPLYIAGRRMLALYPYVPLADRMRVGVAIMSYCGVVYVGVSADRDHDADLAVLVSGIRSEIEDLLSLATRRNGAGPTHS